jgi:hypothetical protein
MAGTRRKWRELGATAIAFTGMAVVGAGTASADPVSVLVADGSDPSATGCANDAYTARSAYASSGGVNRLFVELRYSPRCATAWGRVTTMNMPNCTSGGTYCPVGHVSRDSDGREQSCRVPVGGHGCYTPQVNDNGVTSYGWGTVYYGSLFLNAETGSY